MLHSLLDAAEVSNPRFRFRRPRALAAFLVVGLITAACAPSQRRDTVAPTHSFDPAPAEVYAEVADSLVARIGGVQVLVVEELVGTCWDITVHPWHEAYISGLPARERAIYDDCVRPTPEPRRVPTFSLASGVVVERRTETENYAATLDKPLLLFSHSAVAPDQSLLLVEGQYYCGDPCAGTFLYWFERRENRWELVLEKLVVVA